MAMNYPYPTSSPTSSGAYTTGIRSALKQKGIADEQIKYDPNKGVMVGGTPFIRPEKNYGGSTYTSPQNFQSAWDTYSKSLNQPQTGIGTAAGAMIGATGLPTTAGVTPTGTTAGVTQPTIPGTQASQYNDQINKIIQGLQSYGQNQPAFDPYSSAAYQAAQAQTARQSQQGIRQAQEAFGSAGFGRSTGLGERAQRIGQEGTEYLMTQVLPQIQAQEQARRQQEFQNTISALTPLLGQQSREDLLRQQDIINTGNIPISPEAQGYIDQLMGTKYQAETAGEGGATAETMAQFRSQGDALRDRLAALGIDISGLGAETSAADVRIPTQRTIAGQQFDINKQASDLTTAKINQELKTGLIDQETAAFKLEQLKDPNSPVNQAAQIELELKKLEAKYAEPEMKARIEQIRKQTANIGAAPYRSQQDIEYDQVKLETAKEQLAQLKEKPSVAKGKESSNAAYSEFLTDLPRIASREEGMSLVDAYRQEGVSEDTLQTMLKAINSQFKTP